MEETKYEEELKNLKKGGDCEWWKPEEGIHKITFLENIPQPVLRSILVEGVEKKVVQTDINIKISDKRYKWTVTKAETENSLWGQLMRLGAHYKDLTGKTISLIVQGQNKQRKYSIYEVAELKQKQQKI